MKNFRCGIGLLFVLILFPLSSYARWADFKDAPYAVNFEKIKTKIKKNGSFTSIIETQLEILKESARIDQGLARLLYNESGGHIKILEARTINPHKSIPVSKKNIEIKPLASSGAGFDTQSQISIIFPDVNVGSKLYLKYEKTISNPTLPGLYFEVFSEGVREYVQNFEFSYESEVPLFYETHDPGKFVEVIKGKNSVKFKSKAPIFHAVLEEENALFTSESLLWIGVTTAKDWTGIPLNTIQKYEEVINSNLPPKFEAILKKAQEKQSNVDQINAVTSTLADTVRYVGDWRLIKGAYHPHALSLISDQGYGDCKDFTVSTGAILKKLGFEVHAAWVYRGTDIIFSPLKIAAPLINHAILYAKKDGKEFWIDPTNTTSFAQGTYEDIEDRPAVVLFPTGAQLLHTSTSRADDGTRSVKLNLDFSGKDVIKGHGEMILRGNASTSMTASELSSEKKSLDYDLLTWATNRNNLLSWNFGDYNLKSRIVTDLSTTFQFQEPWVPLLTSSGKGYAIPSLNYVSFFKGKSPNRVTALNMTTPGKSHKEYIISGRDVHLPNDLECKGTSDWADYSRRIYKKSGSIVVSDDFVLKVKLIPPQIVASKEFNLFQDNLVSCMQDAVIVFK